MACRSDSPLTVASWHYWSSIHFADQHTPLLVVVTHPVAWEEKPHPKAKSRTAEHCMLLVARSPEEEADYMRTVAARRPAESHVTPEMWLGCLQRAMYDWAKSYDRVRKLTFWT